MEVKNEFLSRSLTVEEAVKKCEDLQIKTGKTWFFKVNKGTIKLVCEE